MQTRQTQPRVRWCRFWGIFSPTIVIVAALLMMMALGPDPARGQNAPPANSTQPPISVQVNVVNVFATVRDRKGAIVSGLGKNDFELQEDGRPQAIAYFARDSDLPLKLGLLVDTSESQNRVLGEERAASFSFFDQMLRDDMDLAFILHFDREVELLQDFTPSRQQLQSALDSMERPRLERAGQDRAGAGQRRGGGVTGGTTLYDAIFLAANELMKPQQGRKALVVLSDGVDRGSKVTLQEAIEAAQRADTIVYSILFAGDEGGGFNRRGNFPGGGSPSPGGYPGGYGGRGGGPRGGGGRFPQERPDGRKILQRIADETGGRMFEREKSDSTDKVYAQIEQELRSQYSLAYKPSKLEPGYHKLELMTKQKGLTVRARQGYYSAEPQG